MLYCRVLFISHGKCSVLVKKDYSELESFPCLDNIGHLKNS